MFTKSYVGWRCGSVLNHLAFGMPRVRPLTLKTCHRVVYLKKKADNKIMCIIYSQLCSSMHKIYSWLFSFIFCCCAKHNDQKPLREGKALFQLVGLSCEPDEQELREEPG